MQKNIHFRKIPDYIEQELQRIKSHNIIVAAIVVANKSEIAKGAYRHLGIYMSNGHVEYPSSIPPDRLDGVFARRNRDGYEHIFKNHPKVTKTLWWLSPNFGDPSKGYHSNYRNILVYQRRLDPPRDWEIKLTVISENENSIRFKAEIHDVLNRQSTLFKDNLFFAINLLQEQFRDCHVFDASMTDDDIARVTAVGWDIFPPGTMEQTLTIITNRMKNQTPVRKKEIERRTGFLERLHPTEYIVGRGMNSRYFGAKFGDNIVVFENIDYGNALYILFDNWQEISQMSRIDILKRHEKDYFRIIHKNGWFSKLKHYINILKEGNHGN